MNGIRQQLKLAGWYGIEDREAEVFLTGCRDGVHIHVSIPSTEIMGIGPNETKILPWSEIPEDRDVVEFVRPMAVEIAERLSK